MTFYNSFREVRPTLQGLFLEAADRQYGDCLRDPRLSRQTDIAAFSHTKGCQHKPLEVTLTQRLRPKDHRESDQDGA